MMKKLLQNTNEKTQLDKVKYSKLFRKHDASIPLHSNSRKYNIKKLQPNTKINFTNTKKPNKYTKKNP